MLLRVFNLVSRDGFCLFSACATKHANNQQPELASTGRAGCQNKECKDQKAKIEKGELRFGTWVDSQNFQSFFWRHW